MYPAAGEAKLPETDGAMSRLKRRRWQAISAKAIVNPKMPKACMTSRNVPITPATNKCDMHEVQRRRSRRNNLHDRPGKPSSQVCETTTKADHREAVRSKVSNTNTFFYS